MNSALFGIGFILFLIGVIALGLSINDGQYYLFTLDSGDRPYSYLGLPLIGIGTVLMIAASLIPDITSSTVTRRVETDDEPPRTVKKTRYVEVRND